MADPGIASDAPGIAAGETAISSLATKPRKLRDLVIEALRVRHYSLRTERAYMAWIRRFIDWSGGRHPRTMGGPEVQAWLSWLATDGDISDNTQRQALSAILFLYRHALGTQLPWMDNIVRAKPSQHLPVVLSRAELQALLPHLIGERGLILRLMYGTGMRLDEALTLRVKDLDVGGESMGEARTMGAHSTETQTAVYVRHKTARKTGATR